MNKHNFPPGSLENLLTPAEKWLIGWGRVITPEKYLGKLGHIAHYRPTGSIEADLTGQNQIEYQELSVTKYRENPRVMVWINSIPIAVVTYALNNRIVAVTTIQFADELLDYLEAAQSMEALK